VNCNQELCIELWSVINLHCEIEPANLLQYIYIYIYIYIYVCVCVCVCVCKSNTLIQTAD
jgi:hypothetical protein